MQSACSASGGSPVTPWQKLDCRWVDELCVNLLLCHLHQVFRDGPGLLQLASIIAQNDAPATGVGGGILAAQG